MKRSSRPRLIGAIPLAKLIGGKAFEVVNSTDTGSNGPDALKCDVDVVSSSGERTIHVHTEEHNGEVYLGVSLF